MIIALDKVTIGARETQAAVATMETILARQASVSAERAAFHLDNMTLQLEQADAEGFRGIAFEVRDLEAAFRSAERRALEPQPPASLPEGRTVRLSEEGTHGIPTQLIQYTGLRTVAPAAAIAEGEVTGLDHIVIRTTHPNRAAALFGARLGLDMRLDRTEPKWGARLMFFRCGDLVVEIVHDLNDEPSDAPDRLWGLSWRVANAELANARLKANGVDVSDVRPGRKPGTRVFTVRDGTLGVPTLMVEPSPPNR